jgi:hypothetical protein
MFSASSPFRCIRRRLDGCRQKPAVEFRLKTAARGQQGKMPDKLTACNAQILTVLLHRKFPTICNNGHSIELASLQFWMAW